MGEHAKGSFLVLLASQVLGLVKLLMTHNTSWTEVFVQPA